MSHSSLVVPFPVRRLLAMSRDLLQAPDLRSVLDLIGPVIHELLECDEALLLADLGEEEYAAAFGPNGFVQPADRQGSLYLRTCDAKSARSALVLPEVEIVATGDAKGPKPAGSGSLIVDLFPPLEPVGALSVQWKRTLGHDRLAGNRVLLGYLTELTGAALGNVLDRLVLEERIAVHTQEAATASHAHAAELHRRNAVDREKDRIAITDVLTGLLNRRGFFLHAEQSFKVARRKGMTSAVIFADIDGLKTINDRLGHEAGDLFIRSGAKLFGGSFRDSDVVARLGGDEFVAFTVDSAHPDAILARIRKNIDEFQHRTFPPTLPPYRLSFSTGIAQCDPSADLTLMDYLSLADKRMYAEKKRRHLASRAAAKA